MSPWPITYECGYCGRISILQTWHSSPPSKTFGERKSCTKQHVSGICVGLGTLALASLQLSKKADFYMTKG